MCKVHQTLFSRKVNLSFGYPCVILYDEGEKRFITGFYIRDFRLQRWNASDSLKGGIEKVRKHGYLDRYVRCIPSICLLYAPEERHCVMCLIACFSIFAVTILHVDGFLSRRTCDPTLV